MQFSRPSRKRAGTSTNAIPQDSARRMRLDPSADTTQNEQYSKINTQSYSYGASSNTTTTTTTGPIPIPSSTMAPTPISTPAYNNHPFRYIIPPTPCSTPESRGPSSCQAGLDCFGFPINVQYSRPGYRPTQQRNEFPFPVQPLPRQLQKVRLELTIPEETVEFDLEITAKDDNTEQSQVYQCPLPTSPRSGPSVPISFPCSPPSTSCVPPTPSSSFSSSGLPSLSSSCSPSSPKTPLTPHSRFNSAANSLKLVLMANDVGMSLQELEELNEFATAPMSGSFKRAGRVLVRRDVQQRGDGEAGKSKREAVTGWCAGLFHRREECVSENCGKHATAVGWKDVNWSRFSDTTDEDVSMSGVGVDVGLDADTQEDEITAMEGYIRMAAAAEADGDNRRSSNIVSGVVVKTAEVGRRVRPGDFGVRTDGGVKGAVGPTGESGC